MAEMELPDIDLEGHVVIMTGADRGLGRAMSLGLAKKGARLVLASPVVDGLNAVAQEIAAIAGPGRALAVETDITDLKSCANCLRAAVDTFGVLHVLVNNARRLRRDADKPEEAAGHLPFWAVDPVLYRETVEVNVTGTYFMSRTDISTVAAIEYIRRPLWLLIESDRLVTKSGSDWGAP
jgi:NAD(P)-dependent dehydrogenase (short-subunit alcohol dehydrogenase family)